MTLNYCVQSQSLQTAPNQQFSSTGAYPQTRQTHRCFSHTPPVSPEASPADKKKQKQNPALAMGFKMLILKSKKLVTRSSAIDWELMSSVRLASCGGF